MISSVALPKVALSSPPMVSFVWSASCSVASPSSAARGRMATHASEKMAPWLVEGRRRLGAGLGLAVLRPAGVLAHPKPNPKPKLETQPQPEHAPEAEVLARRGDRAQHEQQVELVGGEHLDGASDEAQLLRGRLGDHRLAG